MTSTSDGVRLAARQLIVQDRTIAEPGGRLAPDEPIGRDAELRELGDLIARARSGNGRLVLVSGEAGVGKTCLADAAMRRAREAGLGVLWARCWEGGAAPAYWPWSQILRDLLKLHARDEAVGPADAVTTLLQRISPHGVSSVDLPRSSDEAFRLHDELVQLLVQTASHQPSLIVLDDVHAASEPDLSLLRLLSAELANTPLVVLATHRPSTVHPRPGAERLLADLVRGAVHLPLGGLDAIAVADLATRVAGVPPSPAVTARLLDTTGGNPFFLVEIVRSLASQGWSAIEEPHVRTPLPVGVREAVRMRLEPLPPDVLRTLRIAAVIGREFDLATLQAAAMVDVDDLLAALSVAVESGLIARPPVGPGRYAFAHALYCEVLYGDLPDADRVRTHAALATVLQARHVGDEGLMLTEIARHHVEASPLVDAATAAGWTHRAAVRASAVRAHPEAARWYERTLELLMSLGTPSDDVLRCALDLGDAQLRAGRTVEARMTFERAADMAERLGSDEGFASAALGRATGLGGYGFVADADPAVIRLLERALDRIGDEDSPLRVRLLSRLAVELYYTDQVSRRRDLIDEALTVAERLGDERTALVARYSQLVVGQGPDDVEVRLTGAAAIIAGGQRLDDDELELRGRHLRIVALLERGDLREADAEIGRFARATQRSLRPLYHWQLGVLRAMRAFMAGRFDEAEGHSHAALEVGEPVLGVTARVVFGVQICQVRWAQGRVDEVLPAIRLYVQEYPSSAWAGALSFMEAQLGHADSARRQLERLVELDGPTLARDGNWIVTLCELAMTCEALGDAERASTLHRELSPYAGQLAIANAGAASFGSVSVFLGLTAAALGDLDAAERHLESGLAQNGAVGDQPLTLWALRHYARVLRRRGQAGDAIRAAEMERGLRSSATELGMAWLLEGIGDEPPAPASGPDDDPIELVLKREGEYWTVGSPAGLARLRDSAGLRHLHRLLRTPGVEIHSLDMVTSNGTQRGAVDVETVNGYDNGTGPALDERAKREYRRRLAELEEDLQEATGYNDPERAAACRAEVDALTTELARAVGLGGRDRPTASGSERARVSVTKAIRRAICNIEQHLPEVASHLQRSIRTGTSCVYEPVQPQVWRL